MFTEFNLKDTVHIVFSKNSPYDTTGNVYLKPKDGVVVFICNDPMAKYPYMVQLEDLSYVFINSSMTI